MKKYIKIYKKTAIFIALISAFYCVSLIQETYAKYISSATGTANLTLAKWNIKINNQDIINNSNFSTTISPTFEGTENIKNGVIAPTSKGSFNITLDMTNVDVSLMYTISAEISNSNTVNDLKIKSYTINNVETTYNDPIANQVLVNDSNKTVTITFNVEWIEDSEDGATMNNADDTNASNNGIAAIDINVNFIQIR